jgi:hypothetical protein
VAESGDTGEHLQVLLLFTHYCICPHISVSRDPKAGPTGWALPLLTGLGMLAGVHVFLSPSPWQPVLLLCLAFPLLWVLVLNLIFPLSPLSPLCWAFFHPQQHSGAPIPAGQISEATEASESFLSR